MAAHAASSQTAQEALQGRSRASSTFLAGYTAIEYFSDKKLGGFWFWPDL
jgi:hypothetical protein